MASPPALLIDKKISRPIRRVGLIADTHGLMRPEALKALQRSDLIIHCGDIGNPAVLSALERVAPVRAIRGNNDRDAWARDLPATEIITAGTHSIYFLHNLSELALDPAAAGFAAVISGHSHKPVIKRVNGILFVNPGSAGPRRLKLPVTVATLAIRPGGCEAGIIELI